MPYKSRLHASVTSDNAIWSKAVWLWTALLCSSLNSFLFSSCSVQEVWCAASLTAQYRRMFGKAVHGTGQILTGICIAWLERGREKQCSRKLTQSAQLCKCPLPRVCSSTWITYIMSSFLLLALIKILFQLFFTLLLNQSHLIITSVNAATTLQLFFLQTKLFAHFIPSSFTVMETPFRDE